MSYNLEFIDKKKVFGTEEWATKTYNIINGCSHDCKYCYSKEMAIRFKRATGTTWHNETVRTHSVEQRIGKANGMVMFPSAHDISPQHIQENIAFIGRLLDAGNKVLIVSKPHLECIHAICNAFHDRKEQILFRFSIGSLDTKVLEFWEPNAPNFEERFESLRYAFKRGFNTSVSCEPILDTNTYALVEKLQDYITDSIWIGIPNFLLRRLKMNGCNDVFTIKKANQLMESLNNEYIFRLFNHLKNNHLIKWKESIKKIIGLEISIEKGLDI